jgi:hypothetical protein
VLIGFEDLEPAVGDLRPWVLDDCQAHVAYFWRLPYSKPKTYLKFAKQQEFDEKVKTR